MSVTRATVSRLAKARSTRSAPSGDHANEVRYVQSTRPIHARSDSLSSRNGSGMSPASSRSVWTQPGTLAGIIGFGDRLRGRARGGGQLPAGVQRSAGSGRCGRRRSRSLDGSGGQAAVDPPLQEKEGDEGRDDDDDRAGGDDLPLRAERSLEPEQRRRDEAFTRQIEEGGVELVVDRDALDDHDGGDRGLAAAEARCASRSSSGWPRRSSPLRRARPGSTA